MHERSVTAVMNILDPGADLLNDVSLNFSMERTMISMNWVLLSLKSVFRFTIVVNVALGA